MSMRTRRLVFLVRLLANARFDGTANRHVKDYQLASTQMAADAFFESMVDPSLFTQQSMASLLPPGPFVPPPPTNLEMPVMSSDMKAAAEAERADSLQVEPPTAHIESLESDMEIRNEIVGEISEQPLSVMNSSLPVCS